MSMKNIISAIKYSVVFLTGLLVASTASIAQSDDEAELAKKLSNPVAALISVPLQFNYDGRIGLLDKGQKSTLNIQPVIPIRLNSEWNLISRTIMPLVSQSRIFPGSGDQSGVGDITQSFFFSPSQPTANGIIWGIGPAFILPTGSDKLLSTSQWSAGPSIVALKQTGGWTTGALVNHLWSVAETRSNAANVNLTFVQPFVSYTTADKWTFSLNTESTYNWDSQKLSVPVNVVVSKLVKFGNQPVSLFVGARYHAITPNSGPKGFGARAGIIFLFPT
jgi:hypothetical protein